MTKKKLTLIGSVILLALSVFFFAVCTPISVWASSDILIAETVFPTIWDIFQTLIQFLIFWIAIAFFLLLSLSFGMKGTRLFVGWYALSAAIRYIGSLAVGNLMTSEMADAGRFLENLGYSGLDILFDCLQFGAIILAIYTVLLRKSTAKSENITLFPQTFIRDPNRMHGAVLLAVAIPSLIRLLGRIRYDFFFGAPQNIADLLWMIFFYLADIASIAIGYCIVMFIIIKIHSRIRENDDESPI